MIAYSIKWDIDDNELEELEELNLPSEIEIPEEVFKDCEDEDEIYDAISDYISDETGFCHFGFCLTDVKDP